MLGWAGTKRSLLDGFARAWRELGFANPIQVAELSQVLGPDLPTNCAWASHDALSADCTVFVFDWGRPESATSSEKWSFDRDPAVRDVMRSFRAIVRKERARLEGDPAHPHRLIGINAINNSVEGVFNNHVGAAITPLATHIRQGFLSDDRDTDILAMLPTGQAGQRLQGSIATLPDTSGYVFFGPYLDLDSSTYRITVAIDDVRHHSMESGPLGFEVVSNSRLIAFREINRNDLLNKIVTLEFFISPSISESTDWPRIEFRLWTPGDVDFTVRKVTLEECDLPPDLVVMKEFDCVPYLTVATGGLRESRTIRARSGVPDFIAYGPYLWLLAGHYQATFEFDISQPAPGTRIRTYVASHLGRHILGRSHVAPNEPGPAQCTVEFDVSSEVPLPEEGLLEFLVHTGGHIEFALTAVRVKRVADASSLTEFDGPELAQDDILPQLVSGNAGSRAPHSIVAVKDAAGNVFAGDDLPAHGPSRLTLTFGEASFADDDEHSGFVLVAIGSDGILGYREITRDEVRCGSSALDFAGDDDGVMLRMRSTGLIETEVRSVVLSKADGFQRNGQAGYGNLLKLLDIGPAGRWAASASGTNSVIRSVHGVKGFVVYGPYIRLAPGRYEVTFDLVIDACLSIRPITLDVSRDLGRDVVTRQIIWPFQTGPTTRTLSFTVEEYASRRKSLYEFRIWAPARTQLLLTSIRMAQQTLVTSA